MQTNMCNYAPLTFSPQKGRAINIESLGGINAAALYKAMTPERHWETVLANAESLTREVTPACSVAAGRVINDVLVIVDLKGFGYVVVMHSCA